MPLFLQAPALSTGTPDILHTPNELTFTLPLINTGTGEAANVRLTNILLGSATRLIPAAPVFLGDLVTDSSLPVNARFSTSGLAEGGRYLLSVLGTYELGGATKNFRVHRYIVVPPVQAPPIEFLKARVDVAVGAGLWSYTLFNDEPTGSPHRIHVFSLEVVAPVTVTKTPTGWQVETDNNSYVLWYPTGDTLPNPLDIAPGASLGGFEIQSASSESESVGYSVGAWNHQANEAQLVSLGAVLTPARAAAGVNASPRSIRAKSKTRA